MYGKNGCAQNIWMQMMTCVHQSFNKFLFSLLYCLTKNFSRCRHVFKLSAPFKSQTKVMTSLNKVGISIRVFELKVKRTLALTIHWLRWSHSQHRNVRLSLRPNQSKNKLEPWRKKGKKEFQVDTINTDGKGVTF